MKIFHKIVLLIPLFSANLLFAGGAPDNCSSTGNLSALGTPYSGSTVGAGNDFSFCVMGSAEDQIFYYDLPVASTITIGQTTNNYDSRHSLRYGGACPGTTEIVCTDDLDTQVESWQNCTGSTQRVFWIQSGLAAQSGSYTLQWSVAAGSCPVAPPNDEPCFATGATVNPDLLCGVVSSSTLLLATNSGIPGCLGTADDDVWFSFVATNTTHNFDLLNVTGSALDLVHEIFSGACGSLSSIGCSDPNSSQFTGFTIGVQYYIRVYEYWTISPPQTTTFDLCIGTPPPPPTNDEPCGALTLTVNNGSCSYQSAVLGTSSTISSGMAAPTCGLLNEDIWFQFTVPASGRIIVDMNTSGGPTDLDMAWYASTTNNCNNLDVFVECDDADSQNGGMAMICHAGASCVVPGDCQQNATLTPGETIWVRIWDFWGNFGPFNICAYDPGAPGTPNNCSNATVISSLPFSNSGQTTCCRANTYTSTDGCLSAYQNGEDFIYEYTPVANEVVDITLTGTLSFTGVFVTDDCPDQAGVNCIGSATSASGNPALCGVSLTGGTTYYIMIDTWPLPNCTPFNIIVTSSTTPTCGLNYSISTIAFAPDLNAGANIALPTDDLFSSSYISLGFNFCFDGYEFTQGLVSSNGYFIFDPIGCSSNLPSTNASPGTTSGWSINTAIPNTNNAPRNSILFPWQDINPALGGTIKYQTLGTAPNRRFVLTFDQIPYYSCNTSFFTGQLKLFETTNMIEMHITNKENCPWQSGASIMGLHNYNGTSAVVDINYLTVGAFTNRGRRYTYNCLSPCITAALPVTLVSFDGLAYGNYNLLEWSTASEINNDYFILERSSNGVIFEEIVTINGNGNSNTLMEYNYIHNFPDELEYYRLKQLDFDGKYEYSNIIAISSKNGNNVNIYPNPSKDNLFFSLSESNDDNYNIVYTNILGSVFNEQIIITKGTNIYQAKKFNALRSGLYFIQIYNQNNKLIKTQKVIKE